MADQDGMHDVALQLFRGLAASYDRTVDYATLYQDRYWKRWASERAVTADGSLVLDLGCGTLLFEERLSRHRCMFVGLDVTPEMVRLGRAKGLGNVPLVVTGDAMLLPFADRIFDGVVSFYVPKYVRMDRLARELARVVKPGARAVLYDFARPTGIFAPVLEPYVQVGLRAMGLVLWKTRRGAAYAFENLPGIIENATWDGEVVGNMEASGFETLEARRLTAGAVYAYCGRKRA